MAWVFRECRYLTPNTALLVIVGAVLWLPFSFGVATAMHAHLQQKMDNIAVMKSIGATSKEIIRIYALQTLMLGVLGGVAGVLVGRVVEAILPRLITKFFTVAGAMGNAYERNQHERLSEKLGFGREWVAAVNKLEPDAKGPMSDDERAVQRLALAVVERNGDLTVTETIRVQAEGREIRRGILRDFPTSYSLPDGSRVEVGFEVQSVTRNGGPEDFTTERMGNGVRVR